MQSAESEGYVKTAVDRRRTPGRFILTGSANVLLVPKLAAAQTAQLINVSSLAGPFQLSRPTIRDYVTLLERVFLLELLPPWHSNRLSRLIKTPKLHLGDTGLACSLLGLDATALVKDRPVKAAATVTAADFRGLRKLKEAAGSRFVSGVVLYDGEASASFGEGLYAVPIRLLWEAV